MIKQIKKLVFQFPLALIVILTLNVQAKEKIIQLSPEPNILPLSFYIEKVTDARSYTESIGLEFNTNTLELDTYNFELGFEDELMHYFDFSFPKSDLIPVELKINYLFTSYKSKKKGWTKIKLEFIKKNPSENTSVFATTVYGYSVKSAIKKALVAYQLALKYPRKLNTKVPMPDNSATKKRKGLYASYEEFLTNSPSISLDFDVITNRTAGSEFIVDPISSSLYGYSLNELVWGVCDGENVYISTRFSQNRSGLYKLVEFKDFYVIRVLEITYEYHNQYFVCDGNISNYYDYTLDFSYYHMPIDKYSGEGYDKNYKRVENLLMNDVDLFKIFLKAQYNYNNKPYMFDDFIAKYYITMLTSTE